MRVAVAALSILVLVTIAIGAPSLAHARGLDPASAFAIADGDDDGDADLLLCAEVPEVAAVEVIRAWRVVDLDRGHADTETAGPEILACAPKTSPPRGRS